MASHSLHSVLPKAPLAPVDTEVVALYASIAARGSLRVCIVLALFDLDNTLLAGDSDHAFGDYLAEIGWVDAKVHRQQNDAFYRDYQQGTLDIMAYSEFVLRPLVGRSSAELKKLQQTYVREVIEAMILPKAEALLKQHEDDIRVIVTATNHFITQPIADRLGVSHLIATEGEKREGLFTGKVAGIPCFREGKIKRVEQWKLSQGLGSLPSIFYSDSHNDLPLLLWADEAVAVDPDARLAEEAKQRNWRVVSLR